LLGKKGYVVVVVVVVYWIHQMQMNSPISFFTGEKEKKGNPCSF